MVADLLDMSLLEADPLRLERRWIDPHVTIGEALKQNAYLLRGGGRRA
jgi:hypothetical protein